MKKSFFTDLTLCIFPIHFVHTGQALYAGREGEGNIFANYFLYHPVEKRDPDITRVLDFPSFLFDAFP